MVIELFTDHNTRFVAKERVYLMEKAFGRSTAMLEVHIDTGPRKVTKNKYIVLLKLLSYDSSKKSLVVFFLPKPFIEAYFLNLFKISTSVETLLS